MDLIDLCDGKVVNKRWVVDEKLGEGSCATVYKVHDLNNIRMKAALKYSYVVMSLLGPNLMQLRKRCKENTFTAGTTTRIGVHALYAIKQLHEIGYVHRDIKPANMVLGRRGPQARIVYLIDYGMAREYAIWEEGCVRIRRQRDHVLMRGTTRYCSPTVHARKEQGRRDDLWSLIYVLIELHAGLPWRGINEKEVGVMKNKITDEVLMADCPPEWIQIMKHIRTLTYESRPDYKRIYDFLMSCMKRLKVAFSDPYDWEENLSCKSTSTTTTMTTTITNESQEKKTKQNMYEFPPTTDSKEFESNDIGI